MACYGRLPVSDSLAPVGYAQLLRSNTNYRRLWIGNVISLFGDWFNTIALYRLVSALTGSPFALGTVFICKMLPLGLAAPVAGVLVDRFDRRQTMIVSDLLRAIIVLGFLLIDHPEEVPALYALVALQVIVGSVFLPARSASIPNVTTHRELLTANTLGATTWSVMLAVGAAVGGVATELLGFRGVFLLDSATYLVSAVFIARAHIPQTTDAPEPGPVVSLAWRRIHEGWTVMRRRPDIGFIALAKATWSFGGGGLVYVLAVLGERLAPEAPATGIGILFAVRGLGTGIGPILARRWFPDSRRWVPLMARCILLTAMLYLLVGFLPFGWYLVIPILIAHAASGANWVFATVLLQQRTEDRLRGRVFATEWPFIMLADTASIFVASLALERGWLDLHATVVGLAILQGAASIAWYGATWPIERRRLAAMDEERSST